MNSLAAQRHVVGDHGINAAFIPESLNAQLRTNEHKAGALSHQDANFLLTPGARGVIRDE